jgi:hypothetical protein
LVKKRPKWSLSMGRRRSGHESQNEAFYDGDPSMIEPFLRSDYGDGVLIPHSPRDDSSRNEH